MFFDRLRPWLRALALAVGLGLLAAAAWGALRSVDLRHAHHVIASWRGAALALAAATDLALTALAFWWITRSFDATPPVSFLRTWHLTCVSTLLNYLPLGRAGWFGRTAYLKLRHGLAVRQSVVISLIVSLGFAVAAGAASWTAITLHSWWRWPAAAAGLLLVSWLSRPVLALLLRRRLDRPWLWLPLRAVDVVVVALRLWLAFKIVGQPISFAQATVLGSADMVVSVLGITPNGLGLTEWLVGALSAALGGPAAVVGQAAKLIDRSISVLVLLPLGLWSLHRLHQVERLELPAEQRVTARWATIWERTVLAGLRPIVSVLGLKKN